MLRKRRQSADGKVRVTFELPAEAGGEVVHLVGDFTDWQGLPMKRRGDGPWTTTVDLEPARAYEFRYLIDGERWENDWQADRYVPGPFGNDNSVVETPPLKAEKSGGSGKTKPRATGMAKGSGGKKGAGAKKAAGAKEASPARGGSDRMAASSRPDSSDTAEPPALGDPARETNEP